MKTLDSQRVIVAQSSSEPSRWENVLNDSATWVWTYFGKNVQRFYKIRQILRGRGQMLNSGEMINKIANETRREFINFDQHLDLDGPELLWQTTDVAERNPYTSDLFYNCCAYLAFDRALRYPGDGTETHY